MRQTTITLAAISLLVAGQILTAREIWTLSARAQEISAAIEVLQEEQKVLRAEFDHHRRQEKQKAPARAHTAVSQGGWEPDPDIPLSPELQRHTEAEAARIGIDPAILYALMARESGFQVGAIACNGNGSVDIGLLQINSCNWGWLAEEGIDVHTPEGNISAAARILEIYLEKYPLVEALSAYGSGTGGMYREKSLAAARKLLGEAAA